MKNLKSLDPLSEFPLKERKFARTRMGLTAGLLKLLETRPYEEIKITELCQFAQISEPTFYNYFPEKDDLIFHYIQIWSLMVTVFAEEQKMASSGYGLLLSLFQYTAKESKKNPRILLEIIAFQAKKKHRLKTNGLTIVERKLMFPNFEGIEMMPIGGVEMVLENAMYLSQKNRELPEKTDWEGLSLTIASSFFGIPIIAFQMNQNLEKLWIDALNYIWLGAGGSIPKLKKRVGKL